ncbi:MAG TPA: hypothetical protein VLG47_06630 [Candidatus Saccharimonadales bacterium]|nr:hypothetical protein [Candidatus Saccharimonadales bacterium]
MRSPTAPEGLCGVLLSSELVDSPQCEHSRGHNGGGHLGDGIGWRDGINVPMEIAGPLVRALRKSAEPVEIAGINEAGHVILSVTTVIQLCDQLPLHHSALAENR